MSQWGPGSPDSLENLENLVYPQGLEGQNLEAPPLRSHPSRLKNLGVQWAPENPKGPWNQVFLRHRSQM